MEGKEGEGFGRKKNIWRISCLDNKKEGEEFGGISWTSFVKNIISPKVKRFGKTTLIFLPFSLPFPSKQTRCILPRNSFPSKETRCIFPPNSSPSFLFSLNLLSKHSVNGSYIGWVCVDHPC